MFSIALNRIYLAVLGLLFMALTYQGLVRVFTDTNAAINYGLGAAACCVLFGLALRRWLHLEYLWARAIVLLVPPRANPQYRLAVKKNLNHVLSQIVFRMEMRRVLNTPGVFKMFMDQDTPALQLDIAFPDRWKNHNYLRSALGWIATCMPATMTCQTVECKDTRIVFRFVASDVQNKNKEPLYEAMLVWKSNMQSLLVMRLDKCSVQSIGYVPRSWFAVPSSARSQRCPTPLSKKMCCSPKNKCGCTSVSMEAPTTRTFKTRLRHNKKAIAGNTHRGKPCGLSGST